MKPKKPTKKPKSWPAPMRILPLEDFAGEFDSPCNPELLMVDVARHLAWWGINSFSLNDMIDSTRVNQPA